MDFNLITDEPLNYCVYAHVNKQNGKTYIGVTSNIQVRWYSKGKGYRNCILFYRAIKKYGWDEFEHIILMDNLPKTIAYEMEKELIKKYDTTENGYNISRGGEGGGIRTSNKPVYQYDIDGMFIKKWDTLQSAIDTYSEHIKDCIKGENRTSFGYRWSFDYVDNLPLLPDIQYSNHNAVKVSQYDLDGNLIHTYDSFIELEKLGFKHPNICKVCKKQRKTAYGYQWRYADDEKPNKLINYKSSIPKPVIQKTLNGMFVNRYENAKEACKAMGNFTNGSPILRVCNGERRTAYGYLWEFADQGVNEDGKLD